MRAPTAGVHHVTAIASQPQRNLDFYAGVLGMRLVKRTVNFDDPATYHLYFGDEAGSPGSVLTFFPWVERPLIQLPKARPGTGQAVATALSVPPGSLDYWVDRLARADVPFDAPAGRGDETVLALTDPDGMAVELVAHAEAGRAGWGGGPVPAEHAVRGLRGFTLCLEHVDRTARLLTDTLGLRAEGEGGGVLRYVAGAGETAARIDLRCSPEAVRGETGVGSVHHVAWRVADRRAQESWRDELREAGFDVTPVLDRKYFTSIYFREPGGVLFEIATDGPGFAADEAPAHLGEALALPDWLEPRRARIEAGLPALRPPRRVPG